MADEIEPWRGDSCSDYMSLMIEKKSFSGAPNKFFCDDCDVFFQDASKFSVDGLLGFLCCWLDEDILNEDLASEQDMLEYDKSKNKHYEQYENSIAGLQSLLQTKPNKKLYDTRFFSAILPCRKSNLVTFGA